MAYKALYRTYRPQSFSEVVGQDVIVKTLQNEIKTGRITHAYLFCGPRGTGKTTVARIFAKALNCHDCEDAEPCNHCASCEEITEGSSPDVIEIDAASNNGVDEIRELKDKVKFLPAGAKYKIYIIDEVHMLSASAFNALLKTLEEPPKHAIFILATTEPHKILTTIVSRCQRYDFKSLVTDDLILTLKKICFNEEIKYDLEALKVIAEASDGGLRDAISFLDQAISLCDDKITEDIADNVTGNISKKVLLEFARNIEDKKLTESLQTIQDLQNSGREIGKIINNLLEFYRDVLLCKNVKNNFNEKYLQFTELIDLRKIYFNIDVLSDVQSKIRFGNTPEIYFEVAIIKMINASSEDLDYGKRIAELENKIINLNFENSSSINPTDLKRIRILEEKFNNMLVELSKLELPKLNERVKIIESNSLKGVAGSDPSIKEITNRVDKIIEDLELLKVIQTTLKSEIDNVQSGDVDETLLTEKIEEAIKKSKPTINYSEIETFVKRQLEYFEEKVNQKIESIEPVTKIIERVETKEIKSTDSAAISTENENKEIAELQDRLAKVESDIFKMMAGLLSPQSQPKKSKSKISDRQISLWKDEIVDIDKISETNIEPKVDFLDLNKTNNESELNNDKSDYEITQSNELENNRQIEKNNSTIIEEANEDLSDIEQENQMNEENLFGETEFERDDNEPESIINKTPIEVPNDTSFLSNNQESNNDPLEEIIIEENLFENYEEVDVKQQELEKERLLEEQHQKEEQEKIRLLEEQRQKEEQEKALELENKKREELRLDDLKKQRQELELKRQQELEAKKAEQEEKERLIIEQKRKQLELEVQKELESSNSNNEELDEYSRYDAKVLERIMNDSFIDEFRNEKVRLTNLWKHLLSLAPLEKRGVAEILAEGEVMVVGNHEFVLVYNSAVVCNQVMSRRFKRSSLKLLYDLLNVDYNYFALTKEVWFLKRQEYADQYSAGIAHPTLTPITDPTLKVVDDDDDDGNSMVKNVLDAFGDNITIKKRSE